MLISHTPRHSALGHLAALPRPILIRLGQEAQAPTKATVRVLVQDVRDRGFTGIEISIQIGGKSYKGITNGDGATAVPIEIPSGTTAVNVMARLPEGLTSKEIDAKEIDKTVVTFRSVTQAAQPFVTTLEGTSAALGVAIGAAGFIWKIDWMKVLGESLFVVALFSKFSRTR